MYPKLSLISTTILALTFASSVVIFPIHAQENWAEISPSFSAVDINSIRKVADEYEARLRWNILNPNIDIYQRLHLPKHSYTVSLERIACSPHSLVSYEVERWYQTPNGQKLSWKKFTRTEQALARSREKKWQADTQTPWSQISSPYGSDPRSFVCAYATAQCAKRPFKWPIPNLTPLEGSTERLKALNQAHAANFIPKCR